MRYGGSTNWHASHGEELFDLGTHALIWTSESGALDVMDLRDGSVATRTGEFSQVACHGGDVFVVGRAAGVEQVALPDLTSIASFPLPGPITRLLVGKRFVVAATAAQLFRIDRASSAVSTIPLPGQPIELAFNRQGTRLIVGVLIKKQFQIAVVDLELESVIAQHCGMRGHAWKLGTAGAGDDIVFASDGATLVRWSAGESVVLRTALGKKTWQRLKVHGVTHQGHLVAFVAPGKLECIDVVTGETVWASAGGGVAVVHDDCVASCPNDELRSLDATTGAVTHALRTGNRMHRLSVTRERFIAQLETSRIHVVERTATTLPDWQTTQHRSWITAASFDQDRVATAGFDGEVIVWRGGSPIRSVEPPTPHFPRSSQTVLLREELLFTAFNQRVQRWSSSSGRLLAESELLLDAAVQIIPVETSLLFVVAGTRALYCLDSSSLATLRHRKLPRAKHHYEFGVSLPNQQVRLWTGRAWAQVDVQTCKITASSGFPSVIYQNDQLTHRDGTVSVRVETRGDRSRLSAVELPSEKVLYENVEFEALEYGCALAEDDKLVTIHRNGARVFLARTGELLALVPLPRLTGDDTWFRVSWFPDNQRILLCSRLGALYELNVG